ncbi:hypothetical protein CgunFtcFv8_011767 [Champsocephalus gunnari]|uniref:Uncharacterized protein n=1 Tax=Champsocephalus gunnari TaxID=52237 RepID=A0AAN8HIS1_CHAGU|nr:hypothetical protein CgunFtcFv8_011767 [Champsocephalus gunnari]
MHLKVVCNPPKNRQKKTKPTPSCPTSGELFETSPGCDRLLSSTFEASRNASQTSLLRCMMVSHFVRLALEARLHETLKSRGTKTPAALRARRCEAAQFLSTGCGS